MTRSGLINSLRRSKSRASRASEPRERPAFAPKALRRGLAGAFSVGGSAPAKRRTTRAIARREAIGRLALGGLAVAAAPGWLESLTARAIERAETWSVQHAAAAWKPKALTAHQAETVATIAELIIPQTETAGARAARVHVFIDEVLSDDDSATRNKFYNGLSWIDQRARSRFGVDFVKATPDQQVELLTPLTRPADKTATPAAQKESPYVPAQPQQQERQEVPPEVALDFFSAMKSLTITGYYNSEIGMKEELDDDGSVFFDGYKGCADSSHGFEPAK